MPMSQRTLRTCVVTGANTGIGYEIALGIARTGAHVILACRDEVRAEDARRRIAELTGNHNLETLLVDLSSRASIHDATAQLAKRHPSLDVLVNNAGVAIKARQESIDGIEMTFATNVLGYHLMTAGTLPLLRRAAEAHGSARIVGVASMYAFGLDLNDPEFRRRKYDAGSAYAASKQANRMWTWELARRLEGSGVTANAMHPGAVRTPLLHALAPGMRGRTPAEGADTAIWLATDMSVENTSGAFWVDRRAQKCEFRNERHEQQLWALLELMSGAEPA